VAPSTPRPAIIFDPCNGKSKTPDLKLQKRGFGDNNKRFKNMTEDIGCHGLIVT